MLLWTELPLAYMEHAINFSERSDIAAISDTQGEEKDQVEQGQVDLRFVSVVICGNGGWDHDFPSNVDVHGSFRDHFCFHALPFSLLCHGNFDLLKSGCWVNWQSLVA